MRKKTNVALPKGFVSAAVDARHLEVGETLLATLTGSRTMKAKGQNESTIFQFLTSDGEVLELWGCASLYRQLRGIPTGTKVYAERGRDIPPKKKGQSPAKAYTVGVPRGTVREVVEEKQARRARGGKLLPPRKRA